MKSVVSETNQNQIEFGPGKILGRPPCSGHAFDWPINYFQNNKKYQRVHGFLSNYDGFQGVCEVRDQSKRRKRF